MQASPVEGQSLQRKGKQRRKRKGEKKFQKLKSLTTQVTFSPKNYLKILISAHTRVKMSLNAMLVARNPSCCDASAFLSTLKLIWPRTSLKSTKMSKKTPFSQKAAGVNGLRMWQFIKAVVHSCLNVYIVGPLYNDHVECRGK